MNKIIPPDDPNMRLKPAPLKEISFGEIEIKFRDTYKYTQWITRPEENKIIPQIENPDFIERLRLIEVY